MGIDMIRKRDGREVPFDQDKIEQAIFASFQASGSARGHETSRKLTEEVVRLLENNENISAIPSVEQVQDTVEQVLMRNGFTRTAKSYILYRAERSRVREMNSRLMRTFGDIVFKDASESDIKRENANINGDTAMGAMLKFGSEGAKQYYEKYVMDPRFGQAHMDGDIHIHDMDFYTLTTTCCQIELKSLFKGGFSTGHGYLREPQDITSYAALACIAIQANQNDQHGGQSVPNFDYSMAPGVRKTFRKLFRSSNQLSLTLEDSSEANVHALDDVLQFIGGNSRMHMKTSMKTIKDRFMKAPYGFVEDDVQWLVARLFKRGDLAFTVNGESVNVNNRTEEELVGYITKKQFVDKLLMEVRVRVPEKQKKAVRTIMKELFNVLPTAEDEDTMMSEFRRYCERTITSIDRLEPRYQLYAYPGRQVLAEGKKLMGSLLQINAPLEFFKEVSDGQDELLDFGEDFEPVQKFFSPNSEQEQIFRRALDMLGIYDDSKTYIVNTALEDVVRRMRSIVGMKTPYREIPKLPELREKFMSLYNEILEEQSAPVVKAIKDDRNRVLEVLNDKPYKDAKHRGYMERFEELLDGAVHCNNVSVLRSYQDKSDALKIRLLDEMVDEDNRLAQQALAKAEAEQQRLAEEARKRGETVTVPQPKVQQPAVKVRPTKNLSIKTVARAASWRLESAADVDKYLDALRQSLLKELADDSIVNVEL